MNHASLVVAATHTMWYTPIMASIFASPARITQRQSKKRTCTSVTIWTRWKVGIQWQTACPCLLTGDNKMLERVANLLSGVTLEEDPEGLLLLNLVVQMQEHPEIDWTIDKINTVVTEFQGSLDEMEE